MSEDEAGRWPPGGQDEVAIMAEGTTGAAVGEAVGDVFSSRRIGFGEKGERRRESPVVETGKGRCRASVDAGGMGAQAKRVKDRLGRREVLVT